MLKLTPKRQVPLEPDLHVSLSAGGALQHAASPNAAGSGAAGDHDTDPTLFADAEDLEAAEALLGFSLDVSVLKQEAERTKQETERTPVESKERGTRRSSRVRRPTQRSISPPGEQQLRRKRRGVPDLHQPTLQASAAHPASLGWQRLGHAAAAAQDAPPPAKRPCNGAVTQQQQPMPGPAAAPHVTAAAAPLPYPTAPMLPPPNGWRGALPPPPFGPPPHSLPPAGGAWPRPPAAMFPPHYFGGYPGAPPFPLPPPSFAPPAAGVPQPPPSAAAASSRSELTLLCHRFREVCSQPALPGGRPGGFAVKEVAQRLAVPRRRLYDVVNVLEAVLVSGLPACCFCLF